MNERRRWIVTARRGTMRTLRLRHLFSDRAVNALLLATLVVLMFTGIVGLFANATDHRALFEAHRLASAACCLLLLPKFGIIWRALRRKVRGGSAARWSSIVLSLFLLILTLAAIVAALGWSLARGPRDGLWTLPLIVVHWYLGLAILPLVIAHVALRWRRTGQLPNVRDFAGRRRTIAFAAAAALTLASWRAFASGAAATETRAGRRRFTGSREADYGTPNGFFVTAFIDDHPAPVELATWRLRIVGKVARPRTLDAADLDRAAELLATIDCTGGIYATRRWSGLSVGALLVDVAVAPGATTVWFISSTGHRWPLPLAEARQALLATHVDGAVLAHEHGFPLRLVAPERRGFQWIKWLATIEID